MRTVLILTYLTLAATAGLAGEVVSPTAAQRVAGRDFPSVFQAWNRADNLKDEDATTTLARHDLAFHAPDFFGLRWQGEHAGLATQFTEKSVEQAQSRQAKLRRLNPNLITLAELRYRDAHRSHLPDDHRWWLRAEGKRVIGWEEGGYFLLNLSDKTFHQHIAAQAKAVMQTDVVDGIMLDWWTDDEDRLSLVQTIRNAIGDDALILVNANHRTAPRTAKYVNGLFMECTHSQTPQDWQRITATLRWAETNLREPRINCLETWYHNSRDDLALMRATTTLSLTMSDGYCLFADPNPLNTPDHLHNWYPFWNHRLGKPTAPGKKADDGSYRREFTQGLAVYNPAGNGEVIVAFTKPRRSGASGETSTKFIVAAGDGDLFFVK